MCNNVTLSGQLRSSVASLSGFIQAGVSHSSGARGLVDSSFSASSPLSVSAIVQAVLHVAMSDSPGFHHLVRLILS